MRRFRKQALSGRSCDLSRRFCTSAVPPGTSDFLFRHVGPQPKDIEYMLQKIGTHNTLTDFVKSVVPSQCYLAESPANFPALNENIALEQLETMMQQNQVLTSCIGEGYYGTLMPSVIRRHVLENPAWYTPYTPYQAEIAQGRLESLMNFQTMVCELTGMQICNASLLDEATAAAEAAFMCVSIREQRDKQHLENFIVDTACHPRTIELIRTRFSGKNVNVVTLSVDAMLQADATLLQKASGVVIQYPNTMGSIPTVLPQVLELLKANKCLTVAAVDLLALTLLTPPSELGFDICIGSSQRFGVPMGYGGPHAAFLATQDTFKRAIPGRVIGRSRDTEGKQALRMALQTREQHIRRAKASSNICTAQALLANIAAMYAIYHGPEGLKAIALRVHSFASTLHRAAVSLGIASVEDTFFDTVHLRFLSSLSDAYVDVAMRNGINVRRVDAANVVIALDETTTSETVKTLIQCMATVVGKPVPATEVASANTAHHIPAALQRTKAFMEQPLFHQYRSETAMMRYITSLHRKDYGLTIGMIPLGSCTMKLNAASEMLPVTWKSISSLHPFCPQPQALGYRELLTVLRERLSKLMGFDDVFLQPNSGAQGEYAGLKAICAYHKDRGEGHRNKCFVLQSAHGTNPASATVAGLIPVEVKCLPDGTTDIKDLHQLLEQHRSTIACIMITYPSTYGIFEPEIKNICKAVHDAGGQVYIDGANLNAMVGVATPGDIGGDVAHTNLHKTFAIPHGGGGPGQGPIGVKSHLIPYLPGNVKSFGAISQAPFGSASILSISHMYITMMGSAGLRYATQVAILNANYLRVRLMEHYNVLFCSDRACAHEFILDLRQFKHSAGVEAEDVAKRLMDYNFHAPTLSFPIPNTIMIEPTESEPLSELDRLVDALIDIRREIHDVESGKYSKENNPLKNAPHTQDVLAMESWDRPYSREVAVFPNEFVRKNKFWPTVSRIDGAWGDRNFGCSSCTF